MIQYVMEFSFLKSHLNQLVKVCWILVNIFFLLLLETQTGRRPHNEDKLLVQQLKVDGESRYVLAGKRRHFYITSNLRSFKPFLMVMEMICVRNFASKNLARLSSSSLHRRINPVRAYWNDQWNCWTINGTPEWEKIKL